MSLDTIGPRRIPGRLSFAKLRSQRIRDLEAQGTRLADLQGRAAAGGFSARFIAKLHDDAAKVAAELSDLRSGGPL